MIRRLINVDNYFIRETSSPDGQKIWRVIKTADHGLFTDETAGKIIATFETEFEAVKYVERTKMLQSKLRQTLKK